MAQSKQMFNNELGWLNDGFKQSLLVSEPRATTYWLLDQTYTWGFKETGFIDFAQQARYRR